METQKTTQEPLSNLDYLKKTLKYLGFEDATPHLETGIANRKENFSIIHTQYLDAPGGDNHFKEKPDFMEYTLNFGKEKNGDRYFFNNYEAKLDSPATGINQSQKFFINKGKGITAKESYNLLEGRAVLKNIISQEGKEYKAFLQIDFNADQNEHGAYPTKSFHENYGFDVEKAISNYPIKELDNEPSRSYLIKSLEKGNLQKMQLKSGEEIFGQTNPMYKNFDFYDNHLNKIKVEPTINENMTKENTVEEAKKVNTFKR